MLRCLGLLKVAENELSQHIRKKHRQFFSLPSLKAIKKSSFFNLLFPSQFFQLCCCFLNGEIWHELSPDVSREKKLEIFLLSGKSNEESKSQFALENYFYQ